MLRLITSNCIVGQDMISSLTHSVLVVTYAYALEEIAIGLSKRIAQGYASKAARLAFNSGSVPLLGTGFLAAEQSVMGPIPCSRATKLQSR